MKKLYKYLVFYLACDNGMYGKNCTETCQCMNTFPCNKATGVCYCNVNEVVPENGRVDQILGEVVSYLCDDGYHIVGKPSHSCLKDGTWSHSAPYCVKNQGGSCQENTDGRGTFWPETKAGNTHVKTCADNFTGNVTRKCSWNNEWLFPQYNCVRSAVHEIHIQVGTLNAESSAEELNNILQNIASLTYHEDKSTEKNSSLTHGELNVLSSSLSNVASLLLTSDVIPTKNITNHFLESVSNLIDSKTHDNWKTLQEQGQSGSVEVLSAVDNFAAYLSRTLNSSKQETQTVIKPNIAIEVKMVKSSGIVFPDENVKDDAAGDLDWIKSSKSSISLQSSALKKKNIHYVTTAVMYKDVSDILPTTREEKPLNNTSENPSSDTEMINGPVLSLSINPPISDLLDPPVQIKFQLEHENYNYPTCNFWKFNNLKDGYWSGLGCTVSSTNQTFTVCKCNHLTNFAVLMSPFKQTDDTSIALEMISMIGMGISIVCLVITFGVHILLWKYLKNERTHLLMHLSVALITSYVLFLAGVDRVENKTVCTVVAALLHYIFLVVFCVMLAEGIEIAITVLYVFQTRRSIVKWLLFGSWGIPAIIVGITLGVSKLKGFGNDKYCWLSIDNGLIWAFVGPALAIILFNVICLGLVLKALYFTRAMEVKTKSEKVKTGLRSLCVLVPITGVSWILGIFYINESSFFMQYVFAVCNGLQGSFVFLFHCLLNPKVRMSFIKRSKKYSVSAQSKSTSKDHIHNSRSPQDKRDLQDLQGSSTSCTNAFLNETFAQNIGSKECGTSRENAAENKSKVC